MIRDLGKGTFEVRIYLGRDPLSGKERRLSRTIRHATKRKARELERQLLQNRTQPQAETVTMAQLWAAWLEVARLESSTRYQTERAIAQKLGPRLGHRPVAKVTAAELDRLYVTLEREGGQDGRPLAPSTVARLAGIVHAALAQAVAWDWIPRNPAERASPPSVRARDPEPPELAEVVKLLDAARELAPELYVFLRVSAATGMRRGEVCALRTAHIDLAGLAVRKARAIGQAEGAPYEKGTKTGARHQVAIGQATADALGAHLANMGTRAEALDMSLAPDPFVFSDEPDCSRPWRPDVVSHRFIRLRRQVGLESVRLREFRHFHVTELIEGGVDVGSVSARVGHARKSTTLDRYAGFLPAVDRAAADYIDWRLG